MNPKELLKRIDNNLESIALDRDVLKITCDEQKIEINKLKSEISDLQAKLSEKLEDEKNQSNSPTPPSNEGVKLKIDGLIKEIDECLTLLNN